MTEIKLVAKCKWGYANCIRGHVCKSESMLRTEILELDPRTDSGLAHVFKDFYICPHLEITAELEEFI
jgi:hypothetical protein